MIDSREIWEARRVLGRRLAELRQAAGYNQHQFAPLTCYARSTIANVETGRQQVSREFWERCDEELGTERALATSFDRIAAKVQQHRRDTARNRICARHVSSRWRWLARTPDALHLAMGDPFTAVLRLPARGEPGARPGGIRCGAGSAW